MVNDADSFQILGYTTQQVAGGLLLKLMDLSTHVLQSNYALSRQLGALEPAVQAGKVNRYTVEIYSVTPFLLHSPLPAAIEEIVARQTVYEFGIPQRCGV